MQSDISSHSVKQSVLQFENKGYLTYIYQRYIHNGNN